MATTVKRSDYTDAEWGQMLQRRWDRLQALVDDGVIESHPLVADWNEHSRMLRDARLGQATDDPPAFRGEPATPERNGESLAEQHRHERSDGGASDAAMEEFRIRQRGGANMDGELQLARARRSAVTSAAIKRMTEAVPGYGRLK